ncbi:MAG: hypothetical protein WAT21_13915 [Saprospiraceae bacterium]
MTTGNPILFGPFKGPKLHCISSIKDSLDSNLIRERRKIFKIESSVNSTRQKETFVWDCNPEDDLSLIINLYSKEVSIRKLSVYSNATTSTKELLSYWFKNLVRYIPIKLYFAPLESVKMTIWLNEVADKSNPEQHILKLLRVDQQAVNSDLSEQFQRIDFKMTMRSSKTVALSSLIFYHHFHKQENINDIGFWFCPINGVLLIIIKNRICILFVSIDNKIQNDTVKYYHVCDMVVSTFNHRLENLNVRFVITIYRTSEIKHLQNGKQICGIKEILTELKLQSVYNRITTPNYFTGSGYLPYSLFPWTRSDLGLNEAIELILLKNIFFIECENIQESTGSVFLNLSKHARAKFPKLSQRNKKSEAELEKLKLIILPPNLPSIVKGALDEIYKRYTYYFNSIRKLTEERVKIFYTKLVLITKSHNNSFTKKVGNCNSGNYKNDNIYNTITNLEAIRCLTIIFKFKVFKFNYG